jgi:hypothetical protein
MGFHSPNCDTWPPLQSGFAGRRGVVIDVNESLGYSGATRQPTTKRPLLPEKELA